MGGQKRNKGSETSCKTQAMPILNRKTNTSERRDAANRNDTRMQNKTDTKLNTTGKL